MTDPVTIMTAITTALALAAAFTAARARLRRAHQAEIDKAVAAALKEQRLEDRIRELEGRDE